MKLKYYLKGLGTGILFASVILSISFAVYDSKQEKKTQDDIIAAALAAGMVWPEKDSPDEGTTTTQGTSEAGTDEQSTPEETPPIESTPEETVPTESTPQESEPIESTPEVTTPEEASSEEVTSESITEDTVNNNEGYAKVQIKKGMNSYEVAKILEEAGVLKNTASREEFNNYLITKGYSRYVLIGTFEIPMNATYEEIAKIICRTQ